jgi:hypothetical protein
LEHGVRTIRRWPDPRKPDVIRDESRELGPGGAALGVVSLAGNPTSKNEDRTTTGKGYFVREAGKAVKWR